MQPGEIRARISKTAEMSQGEDVSLDLIADKVSQYTVELAGEGGTWRKGRLYLQELHVYMYHA